MNGLNVIQERERERRWGFLSLYFIHSSNFTKIFYSLGEFADAKTKRYNILGKENAESEPFSRTFPKLVAIPMSPVALGSAGSADPCKPASYIL